MSTQNNETVTKAEGSNTQQSTNPHHEDSRWLNRFEELLKVKSIDELKSELGKIASEIQTEIKNFNIHEHLSSEANGRLKALERRYNEATRAVHKAQKQFDREFNKSLKVLKRTKNDAEKHFKNIKTKISKHRVTIVKASNDLKNKIKSTAGKSVKLKRPRKSASKVKSVSKIH
ncbi:MAG: hypothetical protein A2Z20_09410 [Bdellovibrionales bacterium RBG_16_40_8]|nr:MAG: hypothetical protein A2Z20_09410 [Bdellovibrionales bacterium RBG_16_40_8]